MRDRIQRHIEQRTALLASVSHDLRTPLTRLRLELALAPQFKRQAAMKGDLDEMEQVAEGTGKLKGGAAKRAATAMARVVHTPEPLDERESRDRFAAMLAGRLSAAKGPDVGEAQA